MIEVVIGDITKSNADIIVNSSNGIGFMGGIIGKHIKCGGVAEAIHYETKGVVEKSIAIPLLGTGVGHLKAQRVFDIYKESFKNINDIEIQVYMLKELK